MKTRLFGLSVWALLVVALAGFTPVLAYANDAGTPWTIDYNIGGDNLQLNLTLGAEVGNSGYYHVMDLSGTDYGNGNAPLTLDVPPPPPNPEYPILNLDGYNTDNLFNPTVAANPFTNQTATPTLFDAGGLAYFDGSDPAPYALYYNSTADQYQGCWVSPTNLTGGCEPGVLAVTIDSVVETPEPPSLLMLGTVLPLLLYFGRKLSGRGRLLLR